MMDPHRSHAPAAGIEEVLKTEELAHRPARPPDFEAENRALLALAREMAANPDKLLQKLVETVLELCHADSAGISIYVPGEGRGSFRCDAVAGRFAQNVGGSMPWDLRPYATVIDRDAVLLFDRPARHFVALADVQPPIVENLLVPFHVGGKPVGTLWAVGHTPDRRFDAEDARLLTSLSQFASAGYQLAISRAEASATSDQLEQRVQERTREREGESTEHRRTEAARRASEERMRMVMEVSRIHTWEVDPETHEYTTSSNVREMLGFEPPSGVIDHLELIHPEDRSAVREQFARAFQGKGELHVEYRLLNPETDKVVWLRVRGRLVEAPDGGPRLIGFAENITTRKQVEEELRFRSEQFETLLDRAPLGVYLVDADFRIRQVNPVAQSVFGDIPGGVIGRDFDEVIHILWDKAYADELVERFRHTLETGESYVTPERAEFRVDRGITEYYQWRIDRITLPEGRYGVVCYFQDISQQVEARLAIAESEARYRTLFESIDEGFGIVEVLFDGDGRPVDYRFLETNPAFEAQSGLYDAVGERMRDLEPHHEAHWFETYGRIARTGEPERFTNVAKHLGGRWFDVYAFRIGQPHERKVAILFNDISEQKRVEEALRELNESLERRVEERTAELARANEALRESEAKYRTLFESIDEGFFLFEVIFDEEGQVVDALYLEANPAAIRMTGREWVGRRLSEIGPEFEPYWMETFGRVARTGRGEGNQQYAEPLGAWYDFYVFPIRDSGQLRIAIVFRDVTERKRAEEARNEALRQLVTAEEEERRRISRELHDSMGQLVTALLLRLGVLARDAASPEQTSRIQELERLADRIAREMQHLAVELRPPALDNLGLELALRSQLQEWSERHGVAADFHSTGLDGERLPPEIEATLYRIVQEGLTNVLKHAEATHVSLILERHRGVVRGILEDDGRGFALDEILAAPEKARRLGLRGMRERVALLGGELEVESTPGSGTTLFVRIPDPLAPTSTPEDEAVE